MVSDVIVWEAYKIWDDVVSGRLFPHLISLKSENFPSFPRNTEDVMSVATVEATDSKKDGQNSNSALIDFLILSTFCKW